MKIKNTLSNEEVNDWKINVDIFLYWRVFFFSRLKKSENYREGLFDEEGHRKVIMAIGQFASIWR